MQEISSVEKPSSVIANILRQHLEKRKKANPEFSARELARQLSISQAYVSQIMSGKRGLSAELVNPLCKLLDMDNEKKDIISIEILKSQGWKPQVPARGLREIDIDFAAHAKDWSSAPAEHFSLLEDPRTLPILEATQLDGFDGSAEFLARRLGLDLAFVQSTLALLKQNGYLSETNGQLIKSGPLLEFQSRDKKEILTAYHSSAMERAKATIEKGANEDDLQRRLVSSAVFTCSKDQVPKFRAKLAELLKEFVVTAAATNAEEVYQLSIQLVPLTDAE